MRSFALSIVFRALAFAMFASAPLSPAVAHEGHKMECTDTSINAMNADIQALPDGEAKTTAMNEMQMAQDMMARHDMEGCKTHMDNAMDATEK